MQPSAAAALSDDVARLERPRPLATLLARVGALVVLGFGGVTWPMLTVVLDELATARPVLIVQPMIATFALVLLAVVIHAAGALGSARVLSSSLVLGAVLIVVGRFYAWPHIHGVPRETFVTLGVGGGLVIGAIAYAWHRWRAHPFACTWAVGALAVTACWLIALYAWPIGFTGL